MQKMGARGVWAKIDWRLRTQESKDYCICLPLSPDTHIWCCHYRTRQTAFRADPAQPFTYSTAPEFGPNLREFLPSTETLWLGNYTLSQITLDTHWGNGLQSIQSPCSNSFMCYSQCSIEVVYMTLHAYKKVSKKIKHLLILWGHCAERAVSIKRKPIPFHASLSRKHTQYATISQLPKEISLISFFSWKGKFNQAKLLEAKKTIIKKSRNHPHFFIEKQKFVKSNTWPSDIVVTLMWLHVRPVN